MKTLIYIHGFNSSSQSHKAQQTKHWVEQHCTAVEVAIPTLLFCPELAITTIRNVIENCEEAALIGSSLGGFYANYLAESCGIRAVLINPAVYPHRLLAEYVGEQTNPYTGETYTLDAAYYEKLRALYVEKMLNPHERMVLLQTGDETLDYREAEEYYASSRLNIEQGGDHRYVAFERHLPTIAEFLSLS